MGPRAALITGGNTGIGFEAARQLLEAGHRVIIACRDGQRAEEAVSRLRAATAAAQQRGSIESVQLDLASLASVRACAAELSGRVQQLDVLACNAGMVAPGARTLDTTVDGQNVTLQVNHLGHFLLVHLLLPQLLAAPNPRIVVVSSELHRKAKAPAAQAPQAGSSSGAAAAAGGGDGGAGGSGAAQAGGSSKGHGSPITASAEWIKALSSSGSVAGSALQPASPSAMQLYSLSKLYNLQYVYRLAQVLPPKVVCNAVSPGWVPATSLGRGSPWLLTWALRLFARFSSIPVSLEEGAGRVVAACVGSAEGAASGTYYSARKATEGSPESRDAVQQEALWAASMEAVGLTGSYVPREGAAGARSAPEQAAAGPAAAAAGAPEAGGVGA